MTRRPAARSTCVSFNNPSILQAEFSLTQMLDNPVSGRVFFEQVIRDNLDIGRPDQVGLIFDRRIPRHDPSRTPGRFRTRIITEGVTRASPPSLHVNYKNASIKQSHKQGRALRTETTINDSMDFEIRKGLVNLPALREIGFPANRRLLRVQRLDHDPIIGINVLHTATDPVIAENGTRVPGLRLGQQCSHALLAVLLLLRLQPGGFTNHDLRPLIAEYDRWRLQPGQLLIVDEAGMTGTFTLARLAGQAAVAGAKLLLVGDPCQLSAVETGDAFGLLCARHPDPPTLSQVRRFVDPDGTRRIWEERAADRLRSGDPTALASYVDHDRIHSGELDQMTDAYTAWSTDVRAGRRSVLIAADNDTVTELNRRAQADLVTAGLVVDTATVPVRNGLSVGVGDVIVTRRIDRTQSEGTTRSGAGGGRLGDGFVRNGQRWQVQRAHRDGSLTVRLLDGDRPGPVPVTLTAGYVREHVDLGYATTAHRAQGITVDTSRVLADALTQREPFYVAMTRGRYANHAYLVLDPATTLRDRLAHPVGGPADQEAFATAPGHRSDHRALRRRHVRTR
jgi:hypothetical protein